MQTITDDSDGYIGVDKEGQIYVIFAGHYSESIGAEIYITKEEIKAIYEYAFGENQ